MELPELMTAGRWKSPRMPARYTERQAAGRGAVAKYYQGGGGRGPASQPRETGASEVVAVSGSSTWTPKGDREGRYPVVSGRCTPPSGLVLCSVYTTLFFRRVGPPYNEEMKTMEKLTLTLHKTKDTKNKVVYGTKDGDVIQSVYIDKDALGDVPPDTL